MNSIAEKQRKKLLGKYDFDDYGRRPVSFYLCQAGYFPSASKPVIVWTRDIYKTGKAGLLSEHGSKIKELQLSGGGVNAWGRQEWLLDINHQEEGAYRISACFGDLKFESEVFVIRRGVYLRLMEKAAKHFHLKRCGVVCHPHDAYEYSLTPENPGEMVRHVPARGGWHDAHDDNKWVVMAWGPLYGLLKIQELNPCWVSWDSRPYCLAEAQWEIEWLLGMQKKDGSFYYAVVENNIKSQGGKTRISPWENQVYDVCCDDRRMLLDSWGRGKASSLIGHSTVKIPSTAPKYVAYLAHNLMHFARLAYVERGFRKASRRAFRAADRAAGYVKSLDELPCYQELEVNAGLALYRLERYRLTGVKLDFREAVESIEKMISMQQPEGNFHSSVECRGLEFHPDESGDDRPCYLYPFGYMMAVIEYLDGVREGVFPGEIRQSAEKALAKFARLLASLCNTSGFQQLSEPCIGRKPAVFIPLALTGHGYNVMLLTAGVILAAAGRLLNNPDWKSLAERQLYWVLGFNPRFMSFMNDVGVRNSGTYSGGEFQEGVFKHAGFYRHRRDMRWGITTGIYEGKVKGYPECGLSYEGRYAPAAQETWLNPTGFFLRLLAELVPGAWFNCG